MSVTDLQGRDISGCEYCLAFQARDWQTIGWMQEMGEGCTCDDETED